MFRRFASSVLGKVCRAAGGEFRTRWDLHSERVNANQYPHFLYHGRWIPHFLHAHNCGHHPRTATERTVELALADDWLRRGNEADVTEIGAVTPYYWPGRVRDVIDPTDSHPAVTQRKSIEDCDIEGRSLLSISTLEHIGLPDYGLQEDKTAFQKAIQRIFASSPRFLIIFPLGYNSIADEFALRSPCPDNIDKIYYLRVTSTEGPWWIPVTHCESAIKYGEGMANGVVVYERKYKVYIV